MTEKLGQNIDLLKLIPPSTLKKLEPFKGRLDEVFTSRSDFAHLKYHVLDELSLFRFCDKRIYEFSEQIDKGVAHGWITDEDIREYPWMLNQPRSLLMDIPTYDRIERGIRLHDAGRLMQTKAGISPEEHHFASLYIALQVDGDPVVCQSVLYHPQDVLPNNASLVDRHVRDVDRMAGAGYIGMIRLLAAYYGFLHQMLQKENEDDIINDGIMVTFRWPNDKNNEDQAEKFFWKEVYPFYEAQGQEAINLIGTQCKVILDRVFGRDYRKRKLDVYERRVLKIDNGVKLVEPVMVEYKRSLDFKISNTLDMLAKTRGGIPGDKYGNYYFLTENERKVYEY